MHFDLSLRLLRLRVLSVSCWGRVVGASGSLSGVPALSGIRCSRGVSWLYRVLLFYMRFIRLFGMLPLHRDGHLRVSVFDATAALNWSSA